MLVSFPCLWFMHIVAPALALAEGKRERWCYQVADPRKHSECYGDRGPRGKVAEKSSVDVGIGDGGVKRFGEGNRGSSEVVDGEEVHDAVVDPPCAGSDMRYSVNVG